MKIIVGYDHSNYNRTMGKNWECKGSKSDMHDIPSVSVFQSKVPKGKKRKIQRNREDKCLP